MATTWVSRIGLEDGWSPPEPDAAPGELDWAAVYARYRVDVRAFVRSRVPVAWVDDTVQDTFVRAYRSRHRLDPARPVWPWLVTIAKRACIETCRRHRAEVAFDGTLHSGAAPDDPHQEYERRQRAAAIAGALNALPPRHRRLLVRYEVDGKPYAVLAEEEAISGQALKSALCRARESFRTRYTALAEAEGLAGLPVVGGLLARLRDRWHRGQDVLSRMPPEVAGALLVGLTATAFVVGVPMAQKASSAPAVSTVSATSEAVGNADPDLAIATVDATASVHGPGSPGSAEAQLGTPPPSDGNDPGARLLPQVDGNAHIATTPDGSSATLRFNLGTVAGERWDSTEVVYQCGDGVSSGVCRTVHDLGLGR